METFKQNREDWIRKRRYFTPIVMERQPSQVTPTGKRRVWKEATEGYYGERTQKRT